MELSLADAAKATGKAKSTINDQFRIDPAEQFRVYPPMSENDETDEQHIEQARHP